MKKLKSNRGASLIMALLAILIASFVSVVIISASIVAAKRVNNDKAETYSYYAVRSAAKIFSEKLKNSSCTATKTEIRTESEDDEGNITREEEETVFFECDGPLQNVLLEMIQKANEPIPNFDRIIHITVSDDEGEYTELNCTVFLHINPAKPNDMEEYDSSLDIYKITADIECQGNHLFMSAWIPSIPDPQKTILTETIGKSTITTTTSITRYVWEGIDLSTVNVGNL